MRICDSCISHIEQQIDQYNGQDTNLVAYNCRNPIKEDGRVYGCYYFFMQYCLKNYNQPERSKREDLDCCKKVGILEELLECTDAAYCDDHKVHRDNLLALITLSKMRCSEHCGNTVRKVQ
jgi:hypothetical protein